jgi:hypothetical protein
MIWTALMTATLATAQQPTAQEQLSPRVMRKIVEVKYADPDRVANAVRIFGVNANADQTLHVVAISGSAESVTAAEDAIKKLDVAPITVEMTVYLVNGVGGPKAGSTDEVPAELASTVKQLHSLFPYKSYRLTDSLVLRAREGRQAGSSGVIPGTNSEYHFNTQRTTVSAGTPRVIHVDNMRLDVSTPRGTDKDGKVNYRSVGISTDIDAAEGQKIVVGKSNFNGSDDALILVVTAKVVQ